VAATGAVLVSAEGAAALVPSMQLFIKKGRANRKGRKWCFIRKVVFRIKTVLFEFCARIEIKPQIVNRIENFCSTYFPARNSSVPA
jgi:hypothetical protein